jgi:hypothetical protein
MFLLAEVLLVEVLLAEVLPFGFLLVVEDCITVLWRFACNLVLLEPFLFGWLDWGASAVVLLVFADVPVC